MTDTIINFEKAYQRQVRAVDRMACRPDLTPREHVLVKINRDLCTAHRELLHYAVKLDRARAEAIASEVRIRRSVGGEQ